MGRRFSSFLLAALLLLILFPTLSRHRTEDFMYYYCQGWVHAQDMSPYEPVNFQSCITKALGRPNPNASAEAGSAYPPSTIALFLPLTHLGYLGAFAFWNVLLFFAGVGILRMLSASSESPWTWFLFLAWPGFTLNLAYHKLSLLLFAGFLWGLRKIEAGEERWGGGILGLLALQPQWFFGSALWLALQKKWRALAAALISGIGISVLFSACSHSLNLWGPWLASLAQHANQLVFLDNQSLFVAVYKPFESFLPGPTPTIQLARYVLSFGVLGLTCLYFFKSASRRSVWEFWGFYLLALPYSHGSDILWLFPLFLTVLLEAVKKYSLNMEKTMPLALCVVTLLSFSSGGYFFKNLNTIPFQYLIGYSTIVLLMAKFLISAVPATKGIS